MAREDFRGNMWLCVSGGFRYCEVRLAFIEPLSEAEREMERVSGSVTESRWRTAQGLKLYDSPIVPTGELALSGRLDGSGRDGRSVSAKIMCL